MCNLIRNASNSSSGLLSRPRENAFGFAPATYPRSREAPSRWRREAYYLGGVDRGEQLLLPLLFFVRDNAEAPLALNREPPAGFIFNGGRVGLVGDTRARRARVRLHGVLFFSCRRITSARPPFPSTGLAWLIGLGTD